jgi:hypothetical protein
MSGGWSTPISGDGAASGGDGRASGSWTAASTAFDADPLRAAGPTAGVVVRPSTAPDLLAAVFLIISALIAVLTAPDAILGRIPAASALAGSLGAGPGAALVASSARVVTAAVIGYVLTPFTVVAALAWARAAGLKRLDDPWFDRTRLRAQMRRLQLLALLSFLVAVPHVFILARAIQVALGLGS